MLNESHDELGRKDNYTSGVSVSLIFNSNSEVVSRIQVNGD